MENKFNELEQFLTTVVNNYPPLPRATDVEERLDNILAYRSMVSDYNAKARHKIKELFEDNKLHAHKKQIHNIALRCLRSYHAKVR